MNKTLRTTLLILLSLIILLLPATYAWMTDNGMSSPIYITSNVHKAYFESGDGTSTIERDEQTGEITAGPYEIANPLQLYYFAWLQYLGYFNNIDNDKDGKIDTIYFRLSTDLDMHHEENDKTTIYILPPIGTTQHPFLGNFDGEGHTIKNLTVENTFSSLVEPPELTGEFANAEIIGFFGVVGELNNNDYNYDTQANEIKNVVLENLTIKTQTNQALVGLVAGYVNGTVDCVGVVNSTINVANLNTQPYDKVESNNISNYSVIGYCTDAYKDNVYLLNSSINNPSVSDIYNVVPVASPNGSAQGWGGSINMNNIHGLLSDVASGRQENNNYQFDRIDVTDLGGKTVTIDKTTDGRITHSIDNFGSFVFTTMNYNNNIINFVAGAQRVTSYTYNYIYGDIVPVYRITDGTHYLNYNGNAISSTQNKDSATLWYISNDGVISTVVDNKLYYLTITNGNLACIYDFEINQQNLPKWVYNDSESSYVYNDQVLICQNGTWGIVPLNRPNVSGDTISYTSNNTTNYLTINANNNGIQNQTSLNNATYWQITQVDDGYTISTTRNNITYYLTCTKTTSNNRVTYSNLSVSTQTNIDNNNNIVYIWQYNTGNNRFYLLGGRNNSTNYYLRYRSGWSITNSTTGASLTITHYEPVSAYSTIIEEENPTNYNFQPYKIERTQNTYIDNSIYNNYYDEDGNLQSNGAGLTYFPLSFEKNGDEYSVLPNNTGYIIGAEWDKTSQEDEEGLNSDSNSSNLRISKYVLSSQSMNNTNAPLTMTYKTSETFTEITESNTPESLKLQKYTNCHSDFIKTIKNNTWYGLHFMAAPIVSKTGEILNIATITASLRNTTKSNYQVPTNCIDFNLYERGFINFFAGTYYNVQNAINDSFFSIYEIIRNDDETIKEIKEIYKIYALLDANDNILTKQEYYYTYLNASGKEVDKSGKLVTFDTNGKIASGSDIPVGYSMVFNCNWITHSSDYNSKWSEELMNKLFYFEVPVNAGEYAIGSTLGRTGAYLVYLDLAANAQHIERYKEYEEIVETTTEQSIPTGIEILMSSNSGYDLNDLDAFNSAFASINSGNVGEVEISRIDETTIVYSPNNGITAEYVAPNNILKNNNGDTLTVNVPIKRTTTITRTTYYDNNLTTETQTITVITKKVIKEGNTEETLYMRTITTTDAVNGTTTETTDWQTEELKPEIIESNGVTLEAGDSLVNLAFANNQDKSVSIDYIYTPATDESNATYKIVITNESTEAIKVKFKLTDLGADSKINFIISDGTNETPLFQTNDTETIIIPTNA